VITSTPPEQVVDDADTSSNRFVNGLTAEIHPPSRSVEEVFAARAAVGERSRRVQEYPMPAMEPNEKS
jgi:hypothetical protein